jgi:hypothetical protein
VNYQGYNDDDNEDEKYEYINQVRPDKLEGITAICSFILNAKNNEVVDDAV